MDRGYDSKTLHQKIREEIGAYSLILVIKWKGKIYSGHYRQEMFDGFDREKYHQRNKVETAFSVLKRRFGESLKARKFDSQVKEIKIKIILHNITRAVQNEIVVLVIKEFYRAGISGRKDFSSRRCSSLRVVWDMLNENIFKKTGHFIAFICLYNQYTLWIIKIILIKHIITQRKGLHVFKQVVIITDDSGTILPTRNIWKSTLGIGIDIRKHNKILQILGKNGLQIPTNDRDNEKKYRELLYEYIRPAKFMYAGMFSEVRSFVDELGKRCDVDLYIISGRYGLINQNDEIIPHKYHIDTIEKLKDLDDALNFSIKIRELCTDKSVLILCLPKHYISYLNSIQWFKKIPEDTSIAMITSTEFSYLESQQDNIRVLPRKGVCRLGKENKKEILDHILHDLDSLDQI